MQGQQLIGGFVLNRQRIEVLILLISLFQFVLVGCVPNGYGTESSSNISYSELIQKINSTGTQAEETTEILNESMFSVPGRYCSDWKPKNPSI